MKKSRSALFLMELIIVIFFFAMTSAVCLQLFVKAHMIDVNTRNLNAAIRLAENTGELFYEYGLSKDIDLDFIQKDVPENLSVSIETRSDDTFMYLDYTCKDQNGDVVYTVSFRQHIKEVLCE